MTAAAAGVVFDMDGVLIDSGAHHRAAWRELLAELGRTPAPDFWRLTIGRPAEEAMGTLLGRIIAGDEARHLAAWKRVHYLRQAADGTLTVAGVLGFVVLLTRLAVPRAVATSASRGEALRLLRETGLAPHLPTVVTAEDVQRSKPDPEVYLRAAAAIGVAPERCVAFEDSLAGVTAARGAGMRVIGVTTAHSDRELIAAGAATAIESFEGLGWPI